MGRAPTGVLLLAGALGVLGAGLVLGAAYLALDRRVGWVLAVAGLAAGPLAIYVALSLIRLARWAWMTMILALLLLLLSSIWRLLAAPPPPVAPMAEVAAELMSLAYLSRSRVRGAFRLR